MKIKTTGKSLNELYTEFGTGSKGFWSKDPWWKNESFADENPEAGEYEINVEKNLTDLTYNQQKEKIPKGFDFPHPAVLAEAILFHYKNTGERILEDWYSRTSAIDSDGDRVYVGDFDAEGLNVSYWDDSYHDDDLGVSSCRQIRLKESIESEKS